MTIECERSPAHAGDLADDPFSRCMCELGDDGSYEQGSRPDPQRPRMRRGRMCNTELTTQHVRDKDGGGLSPHLADP